MATENANDPKAQLKKKIEGLAQWQGMCAIPLITGPLLRMINRTPVPPERKIYVLLFDIGILLLCATVFVVLEVKKRRLKAQLKVLENPSAPLELSSKPPIPPPH